MKRHFKKHWWKYTLFVFLLACLAWYMSSILSPREALAYQNDRFVVYASVMGPECGGLSLYKRTSDFSPTTHDPIARFFVCGQNVKDVTEKDGALILETNGWIWRKDLASGLSTATPKSGATGFPNKFEER